MKNSPSTYWLYSFLFLFCSQSSYAEYSISLEPSIIYFNYEEFDQNKLSLDKETGFLPGLSVRLIKNRHTLSTESFIGVVDYDGQTQSGTPHKTDTQEFLYNLGYRYSFIHPNTSSHFFIGSHYQLWGRSIRARNNVSGLNEVYTWLYIEGGYHLQQALADNKSIEFEFSAIRNFNGSIHVDLNNSGYGEARLDLGNEYGLKTSLSLNITNTASNKFRIGLEFKHWKFGRSNTEVLTNGTDTISILEPDSESNLTRFFIQFTHLY